MTTRPTDRRATEESGRCRLVQEVLRNTYCQRVEDENTCPHGNRKTMRAEWKAEHGRELFKVAVRPGKYVLTTHAGTHKAIGLVVN